MHTVPSPSSATTFGMLRHGKTEWNSVKKLQGSANSPLTLEGRHQTKEWIPTLKEYHWDRILASDLGRVKETVEILNKALKVPVTFDQRLREQNWGAWEGLTIAHIKDNYSDELQRRVALGWAFSAPGGETREKVKTRVLEVLQEAAEKWPSQKILVVCHQGVIKCSLYHIVNREFMPGEDPLLRHNSLHLINYQNNKFHIHQLNINKPPAK